MNTSEVIRNREGERLEASPRSWEVFLLNADGGHGSARFQYGYEEIVAGSAPMIELLGAVDRAISVKAPVFILGEKGTGKTLVARTIHGHGTRRKAPFIVVDCGSLSKENSEQDFLSFIEASEGGTLFLDDIDLLSPAFQVKLLQVLNSGTIPRADVSVPARADFRLISAASRDLKSAVKGKEFREDLFYRVYGAKITIPALRERKEDLPLLIDHFLRKWALENGRRIKSMARDAFEILASYSWPGNVSELKHTIMSACLVSGDWEIRAGDLRQKEELFSEGEAVSHSLSEPQSMKEALIAFQKALIAKTLKETDGNITDASLKLKTARPHLSRLIKQFRLRNIARKPLNG